MLNSKLTKFYLRRNCTECDEIIFENSSVATTLHII